MFVEGVYKEEVDVEEEEENATEDGGAAGGDVEIGCGGAAIGTIPEETKLAAA